jgi:2'-5' RNA ligase
MLTKLFVGLTFYEDNHFAKKIQSFRARYDEKSLINPTVFMPLVAPFEIPSSAFSSLSQEIEEEVESFFPTTEGFPVGFTGLDVFSRARKMMLYLNPQTTPDLEHCAEAITQVCNDHVEDRTLAPDESEKPFLTIGRFQDPLALNDAIEVARREFDDCTAMPLKSVCLFQKHNGVWFQQADLYTFSQTQARSMYGDHR